MAKELSVQIATYENLQSTLEADHFSKWVVMYDEELIGTYETFEEAADDAVGKFGRGPYLIRQVGEPTLLPMPPSLLCQPIYAND